MRKPRKRRVRGIDVEIVRSTEAIDLDAWIDQYLLMLLEARGFTVPADIAA